MPELGKATYFLELNSSEFFSEFDASEAKATEATNKIAKNLGMVDAAAAKTGAAMGGAAAETTAASEEMAASTTAAGGAAQRAAAKTEMSWASMSKTIKEKGKVGGQFGPLLGLGAAYLVIKGGITWLKDSNAATLQVNSALKATNMIAGVTSRHAGELADKWERLTGAEKGATLGMEAVLLGFKNIRNVGPGVNAIFDRTVTAIENVSARTGKSIGAVAVQLGKAVQDPTKYLGLLGRAGITFSKAQQAMVVQIAKTQGTLAAQKFVLAEIDKRYRGAAEAAGHSFAGQLKIARAQIDAASAQILTALIPSFVQLVGILRNVAVFLGHHRTLVRNVIFVWIAWKATMFAMRTAVLAFEAAQKIARAMTVLWMVAVKGLSLQEAIATTRTALFGAAAATTAGEEVAAAGATTGFAGAVGVLGTALVGVIPVIGAAVAAYLILRKVTNDATKAMDGWVAASKRMDSANSMETRIFTEPMSAAIRNGVDPSKARKQNRAMWAQRAKSPHWQKWLAAATGITPKEAAADMSAFASGHSEKIDQRDKTGDDPKVKAPPSLTPPPKPKKDKILSGADLIPASMRIQEYKALTEKGNKGIRDQLAVYAKERAYLYTLLAGVKGNSKKAENQRAAVWQQIDSVVSSMDSLSGSLTKAAAKKKKDAESAAVKKEKAAEQRFQDNIAIQLAQASLLGGKAGQAKQAKIQEEIRKHELRIVTAQENALKDRLKQKGLSLHKQATLWKQIAAIDAKRVALAKQVSKGSNATELEIQAAMNLRGSFFSQFASDVFHKSKSGLGMGSVGKQEGAMTAAQKQMNFEQNNHYHEIPKDRFETARRGRQALTSEFAGI